MDAITAWSKERPIYFRLPQKGYQDNQVADVLTQYPDSKLSTSKELLEAWHLELDPDTAQSRSLDFLAYLVGLSGQYWDVSWSNPVKRDLIRVAHPVLWSKRGTQETIETILNIHQIKHDIWLDSNLRLSFKMPGTFGSPRCRFYVRLGKQYSRSGLQFREAQRTLRNFAPAVVKHKAVYKRFYLGLSKIGDPMFSK